MQIVSSKQNLGGAARQGSPLGGVLNVAYVVTMIVVALLVLIPMVALAYGSLRSAAPGEAGDWTLQNYAALASPGVSGTIWTTLVVGLCTSALSMLLGTAITLILHRTSFRYARFVEGSLSLAFYFPSIILAMAWIIIGSPGGIFNSIFGKIFGRSSPVLDIYTIYGIIFVMILHQVPFVYLTMRGPIISMDSTYEEAARTSGAKPVRVLRSITLPLLGYSLASSSILTFAITIEQFAIPALIGIPGNVTVLATQLYLLVRFPPVDYGLAASVGLVLSVITGLSIWAQRRLIRGDRLTTVTGKAGKETAIPLGRFSLPATVLCLGFVALALYIPIIILVYTSLTKFFSADPLSAVYTLRNYTAIWDSSTLWTSMKNTLIVSGVGAGVGVLLASLITYFVIKVRPPGYRALDLLAILPFGVPGIVMGLALLWAYAYLPLPLYGTLTLLMIAFVTRFLPYATETLGGQLVQVDKSLEEAAWVSGSTRMGSIKFILLPIIRPSIQSSYFLLFMIFFREISSAVLLYSASSEVISISIWGYFENSNWGMASALSVVITILTFLAMTGIKRLFPGRYGTGVGA